MRRDDERAFSLIEMLAVLAVVSLVAGIVLPRLPSIDRMALRAAATRTAERLSTAREQAIVEGRTVELDVREGLPDGVDVAALDAAAIGAAPTALALEPDGDALAATVTLRDDRGARIAIVLPPGFGAAHVEETP
jgi:prepilin-type N-terminal cleavage/methylation domain-containing protein